MWYFVKVQNFSVPNCGTCGIPIAVYLCGIKSKDYMKYYDLCPSHQYNIAIFFEI